jgi:hypothetical protein
VRDGRIGETIRPFARQEVSNAPAFLLQRFFDRSASFEAAQQAAGDGDFERMAETESTDAVARWLMKSPPAEQEFASDL